MDLDLIRSSANVVRGGHEGGPMRLLRGVGVIAVGAVLAASGCEEGRKYVPRDGGAGNDAAPDTGTAGSPEGGRGGGQATGSGGIVAAGGSAGSTSTGGSGGGASTGGSAGGTSTGGAGTGAMGTGGAAGRGGPATGGTSTGGRGIGGRGTGGVSTGGVGAGGRGAGGSSAACQPSQTRCSGTDLQTCGADGQWGATATCGAHRTCAGPAGTAACACTVDPVCTSTATTCSATMTSVVSCAMDGNGCFYQVSSTSCNNGACSGGTCCTNACSLGVMECANGGIRSCEKGTNGCGTWKILSTCTTPLVCERYAGPTCADANWAEWPMPNSSGETGAPNAESYTNNGDGTVTDNVTKLMWQQAGSTATYSWTGAKAYCPPQRTGGYSDWRLPSQVELFSIIDYGVAGSLAFYPVFMATAGSGYWSSSPDWGVDAWVVSTDGGGQVQGNDALEYVRCVR
jgi:hypothetical protein